MTELQYETLFSLYWQYNKAFFTLSKDIQEEFFKMLDERQETTYKKT